MKQKITRPTNNLNINNYSKKFKANITGFYLSLFLSPLVSLFYDFFQNSHASATSLTLTVPSSINLDVAHSPDATFSKSAASNFSIRTDAHYGYCLHLKVKDGINGNQLVNGEHSLPSISSQLTEEEYRQPGNDNTWGFLPSKLNNNDNEKFIPGPTTAITMIERTREKNDTDNNYSLTLATKIDQATHVGKYTNTFVLTAEANTIYYTIVYILNYGTWTEPTNIQSGRTIEESVNTVTTTPTKPNHEFRGWCTAQTKDGICPGSVVQPGDPWYFSSSSTTVSLYAIWQDTYPEAVDRGRLGNMQSFDCNKDLPDKYNYGTVTDTRDNNRYKVAKLLDGRCWMIENLKIINKTINYKESDMDSGSFVIPASNSESFRDTTTSYANKAAFLDPTNGGYYTWFTVTAGSGVASFNTRKTNAPSSICPKTWKLPSGNSDTEFGALVNAYGGDNGAGSEGLQITPIPGFTLAGLVSNNDGTLKSQGESGNYWSSTVYSSVYADLLYLTAGRAGPGNINTRSLGLSARCVAREYKSLQKINEWKDELVEEEVIEARDDRDRKVYKVAKLKDGKIWMIDTLRLGGSKTVTLTSEDSDISEDFILPISSESGFSTADQARVYIDETWGGGYNWFAATAGTGTKSMTKGNASSSICPKGWRLPTGGSESDFATLYSKYNSASAMRKRPVPNFDQLGRIHSGGHDYAGTIGYYWSSTSYNGTNAHYLEITSSNVRVTTYGSKSTGYSVRCIAR